jgi:hypothetical protein
MFYRDRSTRTWTSDHLLDFLGTDEPTGRHGKDCFVADVTITKGNRLKIKPSYSANNKNNKQDSDKQSCRSQTVFNCFQDSFIHTQPFTHPVQVKGAIAFYY